MYDFSAMAYYGLLDFGMTFHHLICIIGMSFPLTYGMSANYIVMGMFVAEVSNPTMHARLIMRQYGLRYTKMYELTEILFLIIYIFGRVLLGMRLTMNTCLCQHNAFIVKLCSAGILIQSFQFVSSMYGILKKRHKEILHRKIMHVKMKWFTPLRLEDLEKLGLDIKKEKSLGI